jgi:hypothetical protein
MCKKFIYLTFFFAFCPMAMASDIAISTQAGWFGQAAADSEMQRIVNNVTGVSVQLFTSGQQSALADWVRDHTGDGTSDLLILCGQFPSTIYAPGNTQADNSLAELFLDDGNTIINTGDWIFYVVDGAGTNGGAGLQTMMDIPGVTVAGEDDTAVTVTAEGQQYTPTLQNFATDRPFHLDTLAGNWETELVLAQNAAGTRADPVIVHNTVTGGRIGIFYQTAGQDGDPRGEVISQWINNYWIKYIAAGNPYARSPNPINGATGATSPLVQWKAGDTAAWHDVYFGTNPTPGSAEFRGRQNYLVYWHNAGITPGATYYWRIDEVEADGVTIHTGNVWSFTAAPLTAYSPIPSDGAKWVDTEADLSWTAGATGIKRDVYFGTDQTAVANGTGGTLKSPQQPTKTYEPGTLALDTTYYWRIDEYDSVGTKFPGSVWSFSTIGANAGIRGQYFNNMNVTGVPVLVRIDPTINFNWGDPGSPDPAVNVDQFSARWVGVVEVQYSEPYVFTTNSDDGVRMWLNDVLIIDSWIPQSPTMHSSSAINLVAGQRYGVRVEYYEDGGGAVAQLYWQSTSIPRQLVPAGALQLPLAAGNPNPSSGAVDVKQTPTLRWSAGEKAVKHNVYFGTDAAVVANATTASAGIYRGQQNLAANSYVPTETPLAWNSTYYWRIDEVNAADTWKGSLWNFTTANFIVVDDFEDYTDDVGSRIFQTWKDGWGYNEPAPGYAGNGTGSAVGYSQPPFAEQTTIHGGAQSMPLGYDNSGAAGKARYSETQREWASPQDWTKGATKALTLYFYGAPANAAEQLYVAVEDNAAHVKVVNYPDPEAVQAAGWQEWNIELTQFSAAGVNLAAVKKMYIGLGNRTSPKLGGTGTIYVDDIRVYPSRCVPSMGKPAADLSGNCVVDAADVDILANLWLDTGFQVTPADPGTTGLIAHYPFNGNTNDVVGAHNGTTVGTPVYATGKIGQAILLNGVDQMVDVGSVGISGAAPRTISGWAKSNSTAMPDWTNIFGFTGTDDANLSGRSFDIELRGAQLQFCLHVYGWEDNILPLDLDWHHLAATYDGTTISWYGDGRLIGSLVRTPALNTEDTVHMGQRGDTGEAVNFFPGKVDDVKIWNRALTGAQIAWLAGRTSTFSIPADLHQDNVINFKDFAVLADSWLEEILWP